jgi:hypothetical protein
MLILPSKTFAATTLVVGVVLLFLHEKKEIKSAKKRAMIKNLFILIQIQISKEALSLTQITRTKKRNFKENNLILRINPSQNKRF